MLFPGPMILDVLIPLLGLLWQNFVFKPRLHVTSSQNYGLTAQQIFIEHYLYARCCAICLAYKMNDTLQMVQH